MSLNKKQIKMLEEAIRNAKMEDAVFMSDSTVSDELKTRILNYSNTWIVGNLESLLKDVTKKQKKCC